MANGQRTEVLVMKHDREKLRTSLCLRIEQRVQLSGHRNSDLARSRYINERFHSHLLSALDVR